MNILTYAPAYKRQTVRVLEDAAERYAQYHDSEPARHLPPGGLAGAAPDGREDRGDPTRDGTGKPDCRREDQC